MNERIRQLADEAYINVITTKGMGHVVDGCYIVSPDKLKKFAELIVRECAEVAWLYTPDTEELEYSHLIKDKILKRFGVEE